MKFLKWLLITLAVLALLMVFVGMPYMKKQTKKNSPEKTNTYTENGFDLAVNYSSPSKKGRVIFGDLVPYDTVWRTGANEPTTFTTASEIKVMNTVLPAGTYSLWTIPGPERWSVIFNEEVPEWGVAIMSGGKKTTRNPDNDVLQVDIPTKRLAQPQENFEIAFQDTGVLHLALSWDETIILIPLKK